MILICQIWEHVPFAYQIKAMLEHAEVSIQEAAKLYESDLTGIFCTSRGEREFTRRTAGNAQPRGKRKQIVTLLRQGVVMKGGGYGVIVDIILGILGAFVGGWLFGLLGLGLT
jgi:hypothetical protein